MRRAAALLALAACGGEASIVIEPVLVLPTDDEADSLPELTQIRIVLESTTGDILDQNVVAKGGDISISDVPLGEGTVIRLDGFIEMQGKAVGRTCPFSLANDERPRPALYFSQIVKTGLSDLRAAPRTAGASFVLGNNTVLMVGGDGNSTLELFDPRNHTLEPIPDQQQFAARTGAAIATFADGRPAIIGGLVDGAPPSDVLLLREGGTVESVADLAGVLELTGLTATTASDRIVVMGGRTPANTISDRIVIITNKQNVGPEIERLNSATLARARENHSVIPLGDAGTSLLITGGNDLAGAIGATELFRPNTSTGIALESPKFDLRRPRARHAATLLSDESVLVIGGLDSLGNPVVLPERFTLLDGWSELPPNSVPETLPAIDFSQITLPDGRILVVGGRRDVDEPPQGNIFLIELSGDSVAIGERDPLSIPRANPQLTLLCDGTVLISGGTGADDFVERFNPNPQPVLDDD